MTKVERRQFLAATGTATLGSLFSALPWEVALASEPMRITRIESVIFREDLKIGGGSGGSDGAEFWWVRIHTDSGIVGTGETYPFKQSEVGALKSCANWLLGKDPRDIDGIWTDLYHRGAMRNAGGAEMRVLSAINMAQMDILGQSSNLPLYRLLGGRTRSKVKVYNTTTDYWAINGMKMGEGTREIIDFLLDRNITAMKIYPFRGNGDYISAQELERGLGWIRDIRERAGEKMDICVDCWGRWDLPSAQRIAKALEPYNILYLEDAMLSGNAQSYEQLARETSVPICMSETLATRYEYREFLEAKACDVVMFDLSWAGGVSEARKISELANSYLVPVSPHTCGGPLLYICSCHLCTAIPNFLIMESNYWKYTHQYPYFVANAPKPSDGYVRPPEAPGIGAEIRPEVLEQGVALVETVAAL
jgi:L-alanine-DL-glutamate epimerase-like enolase superfamily enzyme